MEWQTCGNLYGYSIGRGRMVNANILHGNSVYIDGQFANQRFHFANVNWYL
jgi:hypothetical protein